MEKPILFNTEMVKAILTGRKTCTRRVVKLSGRTPNFYGRDKFYKLVNQLNDQKHLFAGFYKEKDIFEYEGEKHIDAIYFKAPYEVGDILYVRETWCDRWMPDGFLQGKDRYGYKSDGIPSYGYWGNENQCKENVWIPSIHMPKEAARIFLKVTEVRVERLQDITEDQIKREGIKEEFPPIAQDEFRELWDGTLKKEQLKMYGWDANPYVWVIEFEREVRNNE